MNLLYWNLKKNKNEKYIAQLIQERSIDIALFSEYGGTDFDILVHKLLKDEYQHVKGCGGCEKVTMVARNDILVEVNREHYRYVLYAFAFQNQTYILAGAHLPANPHSDSDDRKEIIKEMLGDIKEQESRHKHHRVIIMGDFNASPFDREIVGKDGFNAVLYRNVIEAKEYIEYQKKQRRLLYNPALHYISETNHQYGSFYLTNGMNSLYWYCYDQVLMTKSLVQEFQNMEYCQAIQGKSLLKRIAIDKKISDHLPLIVQFERSAENV